jgi:hypothetical protein
MVAECEHSSANRYIKSSQTLCLIFSLIPCKCGAARLSFTFQGERETVVPLPACYMTGLNTAFCGIYWKPPGCVKVNFLLVVFTNNRTQFLRWQRLQELLFQLLSNGTDYTEWYSLETRGLRTCATHVWKTAQSYCDIPRRKCRKIILRQAVHNFSTSSYTAWLIRWSFVFHNLYSSQNIVRVRWAGNVARTGR